MRVRHAPDAADPRPPRPRHRGGGAGDGLEEGVPLSTEPAEELLNVYDAAGHVIGARRRAEAKSAGLAVGAVNLLLVNVRGEVLLQRRPRGKENGGRWDKSVGG